jgi:hypothetical protein
MCGAWTRTSQDSGRPPCATGRPYLRRYHAVKLANREGSLVRTQQYQSTTQSGRSTLAVSEK